jgi:hypothetical protein
LLSQPLFSSRRINPATFDAPWGPICRNLRVFVSPVRLLLIGADSHQRGTAPVPPRLQTSFTLRPLPLHCFFHARPSASAVLLSVLDTFLVRFTRRIQSAVAVMLAKSSSHFPAISSGLLILCLPTLRRRVLPILAFLFNLIPLLASPTLRRLHSLRRDTFRSRTKYPGIIILLTAWTDILFRDVQSFPFFPN